MPGLEDGLSSPYYEFLFYSFIFFSVAQSALKMFNIYFLLWSKTPIKIAGIRIWHLSTSDSNAPGKQIWNM